MSRPPVDLSELSMAELFRQEVEAQAAILTDGLLALERDPGASGRLDELMRAAHSVKGAARMIGHDAAVRVAHAMEDCFVRAQSAPVGTQAPIDLLLRGVDLLTHLSIAPDATTGVDEFIAAMAARDHPDTPGRSPTIADAAAPDAPPAATDRTVRIAADRLDHLLGLAGELLVSSRWHGAFAASLLRLKTLQRDLSRTLEQLAEGIGPAAAGPAAALLEDIQRMAAETRSGLATCLEDIDGFDGRSSLLARSLYDEVLASRMQPFADGVQAVPRMVRDVARILAKDVRLEIVGEATAVDRDILRRLEAPLGHLLRNAVDHAIEPPDERRQAGKPGTGHVLVEARHHAGMLLIAVVDDGRGIDVEAIRRAAVARGLTTAHLAASLRDAELFEFLFLPGFSLKPDVTTISGRGVGLDAVKAMIQEVGGTIEVTSSPGRGTRVQLQLPLTLSVVRALLVQIAGEPYAFPLARILRVRTLAPEDVQAIQGRPHFVHDGHHVALAAAQHALELEDDALPPSSERTVVIIGDKSTRVGLVVDRLLGEQALVIRTLDARLGKVADVSAAALMPDGTPVLMLDVDDLIASIEALGARGRLATVTVAGVAEQTAVARPRVLVVDDSITVRETERKLLQRGGYDVDVAVDGMDAWNAVRTVPYDLVVTDVDMPRLDGIELVKRIRQDSRLKSLAVVIVSYKDREEDRLRGLDAGADAYLTKASFQDDTLLRVAADLIGKEPA